MKSLQQITESVLWPEEVGMKSDGLNIAIDKAMKDNKVSTMADYDKKAKPKENKTLMDDSRHT